MHMFIQIFVSAKFQSNMFLPHSGNSARAFFFGESLGERVFRRSHGRTAAGTGLVGGGSYQKPWQKFTNLMDSGVHPGVFGKPMMLDDFALMRYHPTLGGEQKHQKL